MTQPNLLNLAKQGDTRALTSLLNRSLQPRGITAKATKRDEQLHILLEAPEIPSKLASVRCIQQGLEKLELIDTPVNIYGRQQGQTQIAWQECLTAPIRSTSFEDGFFDAELLADGDAPEPTGGEPTQVSEDWSDQATAIEVVDHPLPPAPPPPSISLQAPAQALAQSSAQSSTSWDNFELDAVTPKAVPSAGFEPSPVSAAWGAGMPVDYSPEEADPTLIVPDEGEDEMDSALNDEDADSEILLSLWDDANLDDDIELSGDVSADNLSLWQERETAGRLGADPTVLSDEPMLVGQAAGARSRKQSSCLPLLLLGLLALLGGVVTAAYLNVPWLAKVPGIGPLLSQNVPQDSDSVDSTEGTVESGKHPSRPRRWRVRRVTLRRPRLALGRVLKPLPRTPLLQRPRLNRW
ncbi:MAG: hypothetical protein HC771_02305 [Synechococcales cyanobacterium CRU_2_2]|nr:hypothetical protein [Synechococcales cyanobacterium CRU_2_2]